MSTYHDGISARKQGIGRHENPYLAQRPSFIDWIFNPRIHTQIADSRFAWEDGWNAEDAWQSIPPRTQGADK